MKKLILFIFILGSLMSCGDDEETCTVSSFVGTWKVTGGESCIFSDATTVTITDAGNNEIDVVYTGGGVTTTYEPFPVSGCGFTAKIVEPDFDIDFTITGTLSDGKLSVKNVGKVFGFSTNCTDVLTK